MWKLIIPLVFLAAIVFSLLGRDGVSAVEPDYPLRTLTSSVESGSSATSATIGVRSPIQPIESTAIEKSSPLAERDTRFLLQQLASLDLEREPQTVERMMRRLLEDPQGIESVLAMLRAGELSGESLQERGAVIAIVLAAAILNAPAGAADLAGLPQRDGSLFMLAVLEALPVMSETSSGLLVTLLSGALVNGRVVLDGSFLAAVVRLRAANPNSRELFNGLLENMAKDLAPGEQENFYRLLLSDQEDPTVIRIALSKLLAGDNPEFYLSIAQGMFDSGAPALQQELCHAFATSAPPRLAAQFMAERAQSSMYAQFATLGDREGGVEALAEEYNLLVATNAQPSARVMIVSGMASIGEQSLIGFAQSDPDPTVRGQALVTSSLAFATESTFNALEKAWNNRNDPFQGIAPYQVVSSAYNLALSARRSGSPDGVARGVNLLKQVLADTALPSAVRQTALTKLGKFLSKEELDSLRASIQ